jgi:hypothetical protein
VSQVTGAALCMIEADSWTACNLLRSLEQTTQRSTDGAGLAPRSVERVNGIVAAITESALLSPAVVAVVPYLSHDADSGGRVVRIVTVKRWLQFLRSLSTLDICNSETLASVSTAKRCMTPSSARFARPKCLPRLRDGFPRRSVGRDRGRLLRTSVLTRIAHCWIQNRVPRPLVDFSNTAPSA